MSLKQMNSQQNWVSLMAAIVALDNWTIFVVRIHPVFRNIFSSLVFRQFVKAYIMGCQTVTATTVLTSSHLAHVLKNKQSFSIILIFTQILWQNFIVSRLLISYFLHTYTGKTLPVLKLNWLINGSTEPNNKSLLVYCVNFILTFMIAK